MRNLDASAFANCSTFFPRHVQISLITIIPLDCISVCHACDLWIFYHFFFFTLSARPSIGWIIPQIFRNPGDRLTTQRCRVGRSFLRGNHLMVDRLCLRLLLWSAGISDMVDRESQPSWDYLSLRSSSFVHIATSIDQPMDSRSIDGVKSLLSSRPLLLLLFESHTIL